MSYNIKTAEGRQIVAGNVDYSDIEELKSATEWKLAGSAIGTTLVTFPNNCHDVSVSVEISATNHIGYQFNFPKIAIYEGMQSRASMGNNNSVFTHYMIQFDSTNSVRINKLYINNNTDSTSTAVIKVYYR